MLPIGVTYAPLLTTDNQLINIIASVRDISHFRAAEELKSTFISVVSHELKTPVALIKGYVGTLRRDDARWDPRIVADSLAVIEDEAAMKGLIGGGTILLPSDFDESFRNLSDAEVKVMVESILRAVNRRLNLDDDDIS